MNDDRQVAFNLSVNDTYSVDWLHTARYTKDWNTKRTVYRPPPSYIKEIMDYNPDTGVLRWKERDIRKGNARGRIIFNRRFAGKEIPFPDHWRHGVAVRKDGNKVQIFHHHLAWCIFYGEWPDSGLVIDHINGNYRDNRIVNLRLVTTAENSRNRSLPRNNKSGHQGVNKDSPTRKWRAFIYVDKKRIHLGMFTKKEDAIAARKAAEIKYGFHENHGRVTTERRGRGDRYGIPKKD